MEYTLKDIVFNHKKDAKEVFSKMNKIIKTYGNISVADFYDLVNHKTVYTDNIYGWKNLSAADVIKGADGYRIVLPQVVPLE